MDLVAGSSAMDDPAGHESKFAEIMFSDTIRCPRIFGFGPVNDWTVRSKHPYRTQTKILVNPSKNSEKKEIIEGFEMRTR
jgi:hypothetical protein